MTELLLVCAAGAALFGGLGAYIASAKNRPVAEGVILGALFGPLGALVEALLPTAHPKATAYADDDEDDRPILNPHDWSWKP